MTWREQADSMTKLWMDTQRQMIANWSDMLQSGTGSPMSMPGMPMMGASIYPDLVEPWRKLYGQGMDMLLADSTTVAREFAQQIASSQATMMRLLEMTTRAWQVMVPRLDAGEDWNSVLMSYMTQVRQQTMNQEGILNAAKSTNELWVLYLEQLQYLSRPYLEAFTQMPGSVSGMMAGGETSELSKLYWAAYEDTFGRLVSMPGFGITRELQQKLLAGFGAFTALRRASVDYQLALSSAWEKIYEQVLHDMMQRSQQGNPITSLNELVRVWTTAADQGLEQVFRSDSYLEAQRNFVNAAMNYRLREREIYETFAEVSNIPTRTEVDEAHRNIYELRREVRALKKQLASMQASSSNGNASRRSRSRKAAEPTPEAEPTGEPSGE